jgi:hypothetical protein
VSEPGTAVISASSVASPPSMKAVSRRRKRRRAQSVVTELASGLEDQIGVALFDPLGTLLRWPPQRRGLRVGPVVKNAARGDLPDFIPPQLATFVSRPPQGNQWLHEIGSTAVPEGSISERQPSIGMALLGLPASCGNRQQMGRRLAPSIWSTDWPKRVLAPRLPPRPRRGGPTPDPKIRCSSG